MPFSASACGSRSRVTVCGTIAANTGQRKASPMPLENVSSNSNSAVNCPASESAASSSAFTDTHSCVAA